MSWNDRNKNQRTVSISGRTYAALRARCEEHGVSLTRTVEILLRDIADGTARPLVRPVTAHAISPVTARRFVSLDVSDGLYSMLRDQVVREREFHGRDVTPSVVIDVAINRMLDVEERR